jgi:integrase
MKVEKLPSGSYRVRKQINKKTISIVFDHKPSQAEIIKSLSEMTDRIPVKGSFRDCANAYIQSRDNVVSPGTLRGYESIINNLPDDFLNMKVSQITQLDIQKLVNDYSVGRAPKTVANAHGFIVPVLKMFRPDMVINTVLPQKDDAKKEQDIYIPTLEEVQMILKASEGTRYHIPFQLGLMGLRRSEVCALTLDDIDKKNNLLTINKAYVLGRDNKWFLKVTKTNESARQIYIPTPFIDEIIEAGVIYDGYPGKLLTALNRYQDQLGIPRFRLHDMRHFFASYLHDQKVSDAVIQATGGWKSDYTMKRVYRHEMRSKQEQQRVFDNILSDKKSS